jgi:predicted  nucleic acid-binding Zn-ribbon protein
MIDEKFLIMAINIRKTYVELLENMSFYESKALSIKEKLEDSVSRLQSIENEATNRNADTKDLLSKILNVISSVEDEGTRLEKLIEPINYDIEKLRKEEVDLYNKIIDTHPDLSEDQIVEIVKNRLMSEGLI